MIFMNSYKQETMKRVVLLLMIMIWISGVQLAAQTKNFDKLNAYKIGFFTKKLNLTSREAEKFWPEYNEYQQKKNQLQREKIMLIRDFNQNESILDDDELTEMGDKLISLVTEESALSITFHDKLKAILPPAKVIKFYQAENQYKTQLLNELQERNRPQYKGRPQQDL